MHRHSRLVTKAIHLLVCIAILSTSAPMPLNAAARATTASLDRRTFSVPDPSVEETLPLSIEDTAETSAPILQVSDPVTLTLRAVPRYLPADGTSETTVWVRARDANGDPVPDGTLLTASTTLGQLARRRARTQDGIARFTLVAAQEAGRAIVIVRAGDARRRVAVRFVNPRQLGTRLGDVPQDPPFDPDDRAEAARHPMTLDAEGVATAEGESYTMRFDGERMVFTQTISGGSEDIGLGFSLLRVLVGGQVLFERPGTPPTVRVRENRAVVRRLPALREVYVALDEGVKQNFVLREPLGSGDENLVLVGEFDTSPADLDPRYLSNEEGIVFLDEQGREVLTYAGVIVRDELGQEIVARLRLNGQRVRIVIPGRWLAQAEYPVVIDPLVGDSFQVNNSGYGLAAAYNSDADEWLVVWRGWVSGASDGLRGQRVRSDGTLVGDDFVVAAISTGLLRYHTVAYNPAAGEYLVAWSDTRTSGQWHVYGQRVNADGTLAGSEIAICTIPSYQLYPAVAYQTETEEWLVVWHSYRSSGIRTYGQRISSLGELLGSDFPISQAGYSQGGQAIAANGESGENLVVWHVSDGSPYSLRARRVLTDSTFLGDEFVVASVGYDSPLSKVAYNSNDDEYLIVWQNNDSGNWDILGQRVSADGVLLGTPITIIAASGDQTRPDVAWDGHSGRYLVVWQESDHIAGQRLWGDGTLDGEVLNLLASGSSPAMSYGSESGLFLVVGRVSGQIYAQRYAIPAADFSATPLSGTAPLTVTFSNLSQPIYGTTGYTWTFGDGATSTLAEPVRTYTAPGAYTVTLTVAVDGETHTLTRTNYITVTSETCVTPTASFSASPLTGTAPLTVTFTSSATGEVTGYQWHFGDGGTSTLENPTHTYTAGGAYTVSLTVSGPCGSDTLTRTHYITVTEPVQPPVAGFTAAPTEGDAPLTVVFTNTTTGDVTDYQWDFGDDTTSTPVSPTHIYAAAGIYSVTLTASGPGGSDTLTRTNYIIVTDGVSEPPVAGFTGTPTSGSVPLMVVFTNDTTDATTYLWDLGDGTVSTLVSPTHFYTETGIYTVSLTATGPGGLDVLTRTNYITVTPWIEPVPILSKSVEPHLVLPEGVVAYTLVVTNTEPTTMTNGLLVDHVPEQVSVLATGGGEYNAATRELHWDVGQLDPGQGVTVTWQAQVAAGTPMTVVENVATFDADPQIAEVATATLRVGEQVIQTLTPAGGVVSSPGGHVQLSVPAGAMTATTNLTLTAYVGQQTASDVSDDPDDGLVRFDIDAVRASDGEPVTSLAEPVQIVVDVSQETVTDTWDHSWYIAYRDSAETDLWHQVETHIYDESGLISATTDHFTSWSAGSHDVGWLLSWQEPAISAFNGAATFQYPIAVPPGRGGLQPNVDISYSSRGVDMHTKPTPDQGPIGLGWSMNTIEIARNKVSTYDSWGHVGLKHPDSFSLIIDGAGYRLVPAEPTSQAVVRYYVTDAPGMFVQRRYDPSATDSNPDRIYWIVKTPNGTTYRLGYTPDSASGQAMGYDLIKLKGDQHPGHSADPNYQGPPGYSGIRWLVDTVTDVHGNQVQYTYNTWIEKGYHQSHTPDYKVTKITTYHNLIHQIRYNYQDLAPDPLTRVSGDPAALVAFDHTSDHRIAAIRTYHGDLTQPISVIDLELGATNKDGCGQWTRTNLVRSITQYDGAGALSLPPTTFNYERYAHAIGCYQYAYLKQVANGYGGRTMFTYASDGRRGDTCGGNCIPPYGATLIATKKETWDGLHAQPATVEYDFSTPCYNQREEEQQGVPLGILDGAFYCEKPGSPKYGGDLLGFATTVQTVTGYQSEILSRQTTHFSQVAETMGRPTLQQALDTANNVLQSTQTSYATTDVGPTTFTYADEITSTDHSVNPAISTRQVYEYDPAAQGGAQYGNRTQTYEYNENDQLYRVQVQHFIPNADPNVWIVDKPAWSAALDGEEKPRSASFYHYDGHSDWQSGPGDAGELTLARARLLAPGACPKQEQTVDTSYTYDDYGNPQTTTTYEGYGQVGCDDGNPTAWTGGDPGGGSAPRTATIYYDSTYHQYPVETCNTLGQCSHVEYYGINESAQCVDGGDYFGAVCRTYGPNGPDTATRYTYDAFGRLTTVIQPGDSPTLPTLQHQYTDAYAYGGLQGVQIAQIAREESGDANATLVTVSYYDGLGRLVETLAEHGSGDPVLAYTDYDALGRAKRGYVPYTVTGDLWSFVPLDDVNRPHTFAGYDVLGRAERVTNPDGSTATSAYAGQTAIAVDANGHRRDSVTDVFGRLEAVHEYEGEPTVYEAEESPHLCDGTTSNGVYLSPPTTEPACWLTYGPYLEPEAVGTGQIARFRLAIDVVNNNNEVVARIEAYDYTELELLAQREIRRSEFIGGLDNFSEFALLFDTTGRDEHQLEYRVYWSSTARMAHDRTTVVWADDPNVTTYAYDVLDNLTTVADTQDITTTMTYDPLGRKIGMSDPDMGEWHYDYDVAGNLITQTDALTQTLVFEYDELNRLLNKREAGGAVMASYEYNQLGHGYSEGYRTSMNYPGGSATYNYDWRGRVTEETRTFDGIGDYTTAYTYDAMDRIVTMTYPDGEVVTQTYDDAGMPEGLSSDLGETFVTGTDYNALGQIDVLNLGNSLAVDYQYYSAAEGNNRLERILIPDRLDLAYTYDDVGNVLSITDGQNESQVQNFQYDALDRLTQAWTSQVGEGSYDREYHYDAVGNIDWRKNEDNPELDYIYGGAAPHAVTGLSDGSSFGYDPNGNMTLRAEISDTQTITYEQAFDVENRLVAVTNTVSGEVTRFIYDGDGARVMQVTPEGTTIYIGEYYEEFYPEEDTGGGGQSAAHPTPDPAYAMLDGPQPGDPEPEGGDQPLASAHDGRVPGLASPAWRTPAAPLLDTVSWTSKADFLAGEGTLVDRYDVDGSLRLLSLADNFDDNDLSLDRWETAGTFDLLLEQNGQLERPNTITNRKAQVVDTLLSGDFEVQVDYGMLTWPADRSTVYPRLGLVARCNGTNYALIEYASNWGTDHRIESWFNSADSADGLRVDAVVDSTYEEGTLKIARQGITWSLSYRRNGDATFTVLNQKTEDEIGDFGDCRIRLTSTQDQTSTAYEAYFDDLIVNENYTNTNWTYFSSGTWLREIDGDPDPNDGDDVEGKMVWQELSWDGGSKPSGTTVILKARSCTGAGGSGCDGWQTSVNMNLGGTFTLNPATLGHHRYLQVQVELGSDSNNSLTPRIDQLSLDYEVDDQAPTGSITINSGADWTNSRDVTLSLSASDSSSGSGVTHMRLWNDGSNEPSTWEAYSTSKSWPLRDLDGTRTVYVRYRDATGNESSIYQDSIGLDRQPPTNGSITINSGAAWINSRYVSLGLSATDDTSGLAEMRVWNDGSSEPSTWEAYATGKSWTLRNLDGTRTVYVRYRDGVLNESVIYQDTIGLDRQAPSGWTNLSPSLTSWWSADQRPDVSIDVRDVASGLDVSTVECEYSTDGGNNWTALPSAQCSCEGADGTTAYQTITASNVPFDQDSETQNKIRFHIQDMVTNQGDSPEYVVQVDTTPPTGSITIDYGAEWTNSTSVTLSDISASDDTSGVSEMRIWNDCQSEPSTWESYTTSKSWTLCDSDGTCTVYVRFRDVAGKESDAYSDAIVLDRQPPAGTMRINTGDPYTNDTAVTLNLAVNDTGGSNMHQMRFRNAGGTWSDWVTYQESWSWTLSGGDGLKTVYGEFKDYADNPLTLNDTITLDKTPPTLTVTVPAEGAPLQSNVLWVEGSQSEDNTTIDVLVLPSGVTGYEWLSQAGSFGLCLDGALTDGGNMVTITATDQVGNPATVVRQVTLDQAGPEVINVAPEGTVTQAQQTISADFSEPVDTQRVDVWLNKQNVTDVANINENGFTYGPNSLESGEYDVKVKAYDDAGNPGERAWTFIVDLDTWVEIVAPPMVNATPTDVEVRGEVGSDVLLTVGGTSYGPQPLVQDGEDGQTVFENVPLQSGDNTLTATATDEFGHDANHTVTIELNTTRPQPSVSADPEMFAPQGNLNTTRFSLDAVPPENETISGWQLDVTSVANGTLVATADGVNLPAERIWDGRDLTDQVVGAGAYLYVLTVEASNGLDQSTDPQTVWVVDGPPPAPVITVPATDIETGSDEVRVEGTTQPGSSVTLFDTNGYFVDIALVDEDGDWWVDRGLFGGHNELYAVAENAYGPGPESNHRIVSLVPVPPLYPPAIALPPTIQNGQDVTFSTNARDDKPSEGRPTVEVIVTSPVLPAEGVALGKVSTTGEIGTWEAIRNVSGNNGDYTILFVGEDEDGYRGDGETQLRIQAAPQAPVFYYPTTMIIRPTNTTPLNVDGWAQPYTTLRLYDNDVLAETVPLGGIGRWTVPLTLSEEGDHTITATATDNLGQVSPTSTAGLVTVDTVAPDVPTLNLLVPYYHGDHNVSLSWSAEDPSPGTGVAGYTLQHRVGTGDWQDLITDENITEITRWFADGIHTFRVSARDGADHSSDYSPEVSVVVDTTPPTSDITSPPDVTNASSTPITWEAGDTLSGLGQVVLWVRTPGGSWAATGYTASTTEGTFDYTFTAGDGTYYFATRAQDLAQNWEWEQPLTGNGDVAIVYDHTPPTANVTSLDDYQTDESFTVSWSGQDPAPASGITSYDVQYQDDGGGWVDWQPSTTATSASFTGQDDHTYSFQVRAHDQAGNEGAWSVSVETTVDTSPPESQATSLAAYTNTTPLHVVWTAQDATSGVSQVVLWARMPGGPWAATGQIATFPSPWGTDEGGTFDFVPSAGDGTYYFATVATDGAGHQEQPLPTSDADADVSILYDHTAPDVTLTLEENSLYAHIDGITVYYGVASGTFVVRAALDDVPAGMAQVVFSSTTSAGGSYSLGGETNVTQGHTYAFMAGSSFSATALVTATDRAGNTGNAAFAVVRDAIPPTPAITVTVAGGEVVVTWSASDSSAGSGLGTCTLEVQEDQGPWEPFSTDCAGQDIPHTAAEPNHTYTFHFTATDNAGNQASAEVQATLPRTTKYYYHGGKRIAMRVDEPGGSAVYYLHGDHLGSTSLTTDDSGAEVARQLYHPYGTTRWSEGTLPTDFEFTGQRKDSYTQLLDYHARFYDPALGRFVQADSIVPNPADPQSLNRYSYVMNSPLNLVDPTGHVQRCPDGDIGGGCGGTFTGLAGWREAGAAYQEYLRAKYGDRENAPQSEEVVEAYRASYEFHRGYAQDNMPQNLWSPEETIFSVAAGSGVAIAQGALEFGALGSGGAYLPESYRRGERSGYWETPRDAAAREIAARRYVFRHYTSEANYNGIREDKLIKQGPGGRIHFTEAKYISNDPNVVGERCGILAQKGEYYIDVDLNQTNWDEWRWITNREPYGMVNDYIYNSGPIDLSNPQAIVGGGPTSNILPVR